MLDLFEKITLGVASLCGFLALGLYLNLFSLIGLPSGIPTTNPAEFLRGVVEESPPPSSPGSKRKPGGNGLAKDEEDKIRALLKKQGRAVSGPIAVKRLKVPDDLYEHVSAEANWPSELDKAHSRPIGETRLQIYNIQDGSLFKLFGFENKDIIEAIDGQIVEFSANPQPHYKRANDMLEKLRAGESISITVTRKSRPVHLKFSLRQ